MGQVVKNCISRFMEMRFDNENWGLDKQNCNYESNKPVA
jgi:hypothetical protein